MKRCCMLVLLEHAGFDGLRHTMAAGCTRTVRRIPFDVLILCEKGFDVVVLRLSNLQKMSSCLYFATILHEGVQCQSRTGHRSEIEAQMFVAVDE
jgi:hypothetical protein